VRARALQCDFGVISSTQISSGTARAKAAVYQAMESPDKLYALNSALLTRLADRMGVELTPGAIRSMERRAAELVERNRRENLTRITRPDEIAIQHLIDSLNALRPLSEIGPGPDAGGTETEPRLRPALLDIGSGAGLPGIPIAIVRPEWDVVLAEAGGKAADFLRHVVDVLALDTACVIQARVEALGRDPDHRGRYAAVTARAVARVSVLVEYAMPLLAEGGRLVALKGADAPAEVEAAAPAIEALGARLVEIVPYELPGLDRRRHVVVIDKVAATPPAFPRRIGVAQRAPLEVGASKR
jgi:16S rRNA (guanine527-N7)-methyltransferase